MIAIWGFGFTDRDGSPDDCLSLLSDLKEQGFTVVGGVPTNWRTLDGDSKTDPKWTQVYHVSSEKEGTLGVVILRILLLLSFTHTRYKHYTLVFSLL